MRIILIALLFLIISCGAKTENKEPSPISTNEPVEEPIQKMPVLGWHQSEDGYQTYNYDVLNMLCYFSYQVDPATGENTRDYDWMKAPIIDTAFANDCKVYLTVTNFGPSENSTFLNNKEACNKAIENLTTFVEKRNANGVCVDFEEVSAADKNVYNAFLKQLSEKLKEKNKELLVVLQLYYPENRVDPTMLDGMVDYYVMMGYACYHMASSHAGPISPWESGTIWEPYNLKDNVDAYLANSFENERFMVALPLYGAIWETVSESKGAKSVKGLEQPSYDAILDKFAEKRPSIDSVSQSSWFAYKENDVVQQCWFESQENLITKIGYLKEKGVAGIGFWALGYAGEYPDLWKSIGEATIKLE